MFVKVALCRSVSFETKFVFSLYTLNTQKHLIYINVFAATSLGFHRYEPSLPKKLLF